MYYPGIAGKELEKIIYYESYVVVSPELLVCNDSIDFGGSVYRILSSLPEENQDLMMRPKKFIAKMGGDAIKDF